MYLPKLSNVLVVLPGDVALVNQKVVKCMQIVIARIVIKSKTR